MGRLPSFKLPLLVSQWERGLERAVSSLFGGGREQGPGLGESEPRKKGSRYRGVTPLGLSSGELSTREAREPEGVAGTGPSSAIMCRRGARSGGCPLGGAGASQGLRAAVTDAEGTGPGCPPQDTGDSGEASCVGATRVHDTLLPPSPRNPAPLPPRVPPSPRHPAPLPPWVSLSPTAAGCRGGEALTSLPRLWCRIATRRTS